MELAIEILKIIGLIVSIILTAFSGVAGGILLWRHKWGKAVVLLGFATIAISSLIIVFWKTNISDTFVKHLTVTCPQFLVHF